MLGEKKLYTIEDLKEGRVAVEFNGVEDSLKDLQNLLKSTFPNTMVFTSGSYKYYHLSNKFEKCWYPTDYKNLPSQLLKDFIKQLTMNKKIIGYKLTKPEYTEAVKAITGCPQFNFENFEKEADNMVIATQKLTDAKVLGLWFEKIYEEEYKVGDWVTVIESKSGFNGELGKTYKIFGWQPKYDNRFYYSEDQTNTICLNAIKVRKATQEEIEEATIKVGNWYYILNREDSALNKGDVVQLTEIKLGSYNNQNYLFGIGGRWLKKESFRPATPQEIKSLKIIIPDSNFEVKIGVNKVTQIEGYDFTKAHWEAAKLLLSHTSGKIGIKFGCSKQFNLDLETVNKVLAKI